MPVTLRTLTAEDTAALDHVRQFFRNYAAWLGVDLGFQNFDQEMASLPGAYATPYGRLFFAEVDGRPAGCVGIRPYSDDSCEMKRLYVRPEARGLRLRALPEPGHDAGHQRHDDDEEAQEVTGALGGGVAHGVTS